MTIGHSIWITWIFQCTATFQYIYEYIELYVKCICVFIDKSIMQSHVVLLSMQKESFRVGIRKYSHMLVQWSRMNEVYYATIFDPISHFLFSQWHIDESHITQQQRKNRTEQKQLQSATLYVMEENVLKALTLHKNSSWMA